MVIEHKEVAFTQDVSEVAFETRWKGLGWTEVVVKEPKKAAKKDDTEKSV